MTSKAARRTRRTVEVSLALALIAVAAALISAQQSSRLATTAAALRAAPVFFHGKHVAVLGTTVEARDLVKLEAEAPSAPPNAAEVSSRGIYIYWRERPTRSTGEVRGEFWDLGRLNEGDPRFSSYDFRPLLEAVTEGRWPGRDQLFVILGASLTEAALPESPTLRAIALAPDKYENRSVTVSGRFRGRNLYADLAAPLPTPTKWDFVVQSADASIWISGLRPRGKGFELDPAARVDTGRWVQVTGTVRRQGSRVWIEAREIELAPPPDVTPVEIVVPVTPKEAPPTIVFSTPVPDDTDVDVSVIVRIQFSRDMDSRSFKDRVRVSYQPTPQPAAPLQAPPSWALSYNVGGRGIELKFAKPFERFQTVKVELLDGIKAIDGEPLTPWTLTFSTGR
jgi:hypothetical protein